MDDAQPTGTSGSADRGPADGAADRRIAREAGETVGGPSDPADHELDGGAEVGAGRSGGEQRSNADRESIEGRDGADRRARERDGSPDPGAERSGAEQGAVEGDTGQRRGAEGTDVEAGTAERGSAVRAGGAPGTAEPGSGEWRGAEQGNGERAGSEPGTAERGGVGGRGDAEAEGVEERASGERHDEEPDGTAEIMAEREGAEARGGREAVPAGSGDGAEDPARTDRKPLAGLVRAGTRSPAGLLIGVLIGLLGFALAVQVRSNTSTSGLPAARQEDLVRILDELTSREDRLRRQIAQLEAARARLSTTGDRSTAALEEARKRSTALGILAGTLPAQGPGVQLTLTDPERRLAAEDVLDAVEELRAAGAEALQVGTVRIGLDSAFTATDRGIAVDGVPLTAPYTILAIGDPPTLATAMEIPGGVSDTVRRAGGQAQIVQQDLVAIRALRTLRPPQYSRPADGGR